MKYLSLILLICLYCNLNYSQVYLGTHTIHHKSGNRYNYDNTWKGESKHLKSHYRNLSFDIKFDDNCKYILQDPQNENEQYRKQKVMKLCTNQGPLWNQTRNSLRIGWCYDPQSDKIWLSFYAHINHYENGPVGREVTLLSTDINTGELVHVKMAIGKKGMFMSINGMSAIVSRDISTWSEVGETTFVRANSFFEYKNSEGKLQGAPHDLTFYISNAYIDYLDFVWEKILCEYTADKIDFMNTNFALEDQGPYQFFAADNIYCTKKSSSTVETSLPYEPPFTVIEPGILVGFTATNSILLDKGFHAKAGSNFYAKIDFVQQPVYPECTGQPVYLTPTVCYTVENTTHFNFYLYYFGEWVAGGTGSIVGNQACFNIENYDELEPGHYHAESHFSNDCEDIWLEHELFKLPDKNKDNFSVSSRYVRLNSEPDNLYYNYSENVNELSTSTNQNLIHITPNPNNGIFTVQFNNALEKPVIVVVYDLMGNSIYQNQNISKNSFDVDISNYPKGIYFVKIQAGDQIFTEKIIYR